MKIQILFVILLLLTPGVFAAKNAWWGYVKIDGTDAQRDTLVEMYINGAFVNDLTTPSDAIQPDNFYRFDIEEENLAPVRFQVWGIDVDPLQQMNASHITAYHFNLSVDTLPNDNSCKYDAACSSGHCCSGVCKTSCGGGDDGTGSSRGHSSRTHCTPNWECTKWTPPICPSLGFRSRLCKDLEECGGSSSKPVEIQDCLPNSTQTNNDTIVKSVEAESLENPFKSMTGMAIGDLAGLTWLQKCIGLLLLMALFVGGYYTYMNLYGIRKPY